MILKRSSTEEFDNLLLYTRRENIDSLLDWLHGTDFYECPASSKYHGANERGLIYHSLSVYDCAIKLNNALALGINEDSIAICALLHDICKVNCYKLDYRNAKVLNENTGVYEWQKVPYYRFDEDYKFGGHGSKSVYLISRYIPLKEDEAAAINCHMGSWGNVDENSVSKVFEDNKLAFLIHMADETSTFIYNL